MLHVCTHSHSTLHIMIINQDMQCLSMLEDKGSLYSKLVSHAHVILLQTCTHRQGCALVPDKFSPQVRL